MGHGSGAFSCRKDDSAPPILTAQASLPVTLLVVPGGPGLGQLLWARVSCPCPQMIRGAKVTRGSRALVTADKGNDPPQNGRGLSQAWVRGPVRPPAGPAPMQREAAGEMDIGDIEVFIGTGRR